MAVTSTHFAKCRRTLLELNSYEPYPSSKRERKFYVLHKTWNQVFSRRSREITAAKCTRKCNARAKLLFCLSRPFFSWFGLPSTCVRRVKTVIENASSQKRSPVEISGNAVLLYSCGWMKHENTSSFENDNVTMLVTSKCACSHHRWYSFQSLGTLRSDDGDGSENVAEEVNSRSFNLHRDYSKSLTLSNVFEAS